MQVITLGGSIEDVGQKIAEQTKDSAKGINKGMKKFIETNSTTNTTPTDRIIISDKSKPTTDNHEERNLLFSFLLGVLTGFILTKTLK